MAQNEADLKEKKSVEKKCSRNKEADEVVFFFVVIRRESEQATI